MGVAHECPMHYTASLIYVAVFQVSSTIIANIFLVSAAIAGISACISDYICFFLVAAAISTLF